VDCHAHRLRPRTRAASARPDRWGRPRHHPRTHRWRCRATRAKAFITGLNLASGLAFGHGGVFILQVPYLLFYPDRDRDDVPDGDPDVLLTGFGLRMPTRSPTRSPGARRLALRLPGQHGHVTDPRS
jgi:hypothetical protein